MISLDGNSATGKREVTLAEIADGARFKLAIIEFTRNRHTTEVVGHVIGTKLYGGPGSCRVRLPGKQRHVIFNGSNGKPAREFDAEGTSEVNYPIMLMVEPVGDDDNDGSTPDWRTQGGALPMDKQIKALQAKLTFQQAALAKAIEAGDKDKIEVAEKRVAAIESEATEKGYDLSAGTATATPPAGPKTAAAATTAKAAKPAGVTKAEVDQTKGKQAAKAEDARQTVITKAKGKTSVKTSPEPKAATAKSKAAKTGAKEAKLDSTRDCLCGCGLETNGLFRPGHDARVKGMLLKVERGLFEGGAAALPDTLKPFVKFAGRAASAGKDNSDYRIVAAPVKFPAGSGHDDVELVIPE